MFQEIFTSTDKIFISGRGQSTRFFFEIFLIFANFLRSEVLSRSATCEATRIYQFIFNNHASFYIWLKENLFNHQKISKYYEHDCRYRILE